VNIGEFQWNSLPAKGLARALSVVALAGCALSLCINLIALLGFHSKAILNFQIDMVLGIFPMAIPTVLAQERLLSELFFLDRVRKSRVAWRFLLAKAPEWMRSLYRSLSWYTVAVFVVFAWRNGGAKSSSQLDELWYMSAFVAAAYSAEAALLMSYGRCEHPIRFGDFD
jgi:hypothetical protein